MRLLILIILTNLVGCVAPGSKITTFKFSADFYEDTKQDVKLKVIFPGSYGYSDFDLKFVSQEALSKFDQVFEVSATNGVATTNDFGSFYHVGVWLFPPIGAFPKEPPPPMFIIEFSNAEGELYLVTLIEDKLRYKVYNVISKKYLSLKESSWYLADATFTEYEEDNNEKWLFNLKVKPNNSFNSDGANNAPPS